MLPHDEQSRWSSHLFRMTLSLFPVGDGDAHTYDVPTRTRSLMMDFTAVAHDLRTPLMVMLGHMRLLAIERLTDTGRHRLEVLEAQVHRMMRLLDTCGGQVGGTPCVAPVDLRLLIGNVVAELEAVMERHGIVIALAIGGAPPFVVGDRDLLHRVLLNVMVNAADSIAGCGRIEITARVEQTAEAPVGTIHIDIADTGSGIPADLIPRVFERGFTTKSSGDSRGFGLGICREIMQMHGGDIRLSSTAGSGTTVRLSLPATSAR
jgi:signal transduction histidine kinase